MSRSITPIARMLTVADGRDLAERLAADFESGAAAALARAQSARVLALDVAGAATAVALVAALRGAGAVAFAGTSSIATVATADQIAAALDTCPGCAGELAALAAALGNLAARPRLFRLRDRTLDLHHEARVMGIVNVTPDSFYERAGGPAQALERARSMAADGAALVDLGGQSYAHWNRPVSADAERARVVPAVQAIVAAGVDVALSIDTFKAGVADAALAAGAHLINDCSGLSDPRMGEVVARHDAGLVIMHLKGQLNVRSASTYVYADALAEIVDYLHVRIERARAAGVAAASIAIDPGLEFGKEPETDLEILDRFAELTVLGYPILLAGSRKSFIGRIFNRPARELLVPSLAVAGLGIAAGARLLRVHDVAPTVQLARMYAAVAPDRRTALPLAEHMPETPASMGNPAQRDVV